MRGLWSRAWSALEGDASEHVAQHLGLGAAGFNDFGVIDINPIHVVIHGRKAPR